MRGHKGITEGDIRYAMSNSMSNAQAARFLKMSVSAYRKYASSIVDSPTGKNLYELHKNSTGVGIRRNITPVFGKGLHDINDILAGKYPNYPVKKLHKRLLKELVFSEECASCGFNEERDSDYKVPLLLHFKDGNKTNHMVDNLEFLCYNCYFLKVPDIKGKKMYIRF